MLGWIGRKWREQMRAADMRILWPVIAQNARGNADVAKAAMALHVFNDSAWTSDFTERQLIDWIDALRLDQPPLPPPAKEPTP